MTTPRLPVALCINCHSPLLERRVNAPLQWRCLACHQEFEQPRIEMRSFRDAIEIGGQRSLGPFSTYTEFCEYAMLHGIEVARQRLGEPYGPSPIETRGLLEFADRLTWLIDGLVRGISDGDEQLARLSFHIVPDMTGEHAVVFQAVISGRELRSLVLMSRVREAVIAGVEPRDALTRELAYSIVQRFCEGRSQPSPPLPSFTLEEVRGALNRGLRVNLTLDDFRRMIALLNNPPQPVTQIPSDWEQFAPLVSIRSGGQLVPFHPYPSQIELVRTVERSRRLLVKQERQAGVTETLVSWLLMRAMTEPGFTGIILSPNASASLGCVSRARAMAESLGALCPPARMGGGSSLHFEGKGSIHFEATTVYVCRRLPLTYVGIRFDAVVVDNAEFARSDIAWLYDAIAPLLSDRGQIILTCSDELFFQRWSGRGWPSMRESSSPPPPGFTLDELRAGIEAVSEAAIEAFRNLPVDAIRQAFSNLSVPGPLPPSCSNCAYLMRAFRFGEPHICNAFHAIADLHSPTECPDYERK